MVSTTACGGPLKSATSHPGATHGGSTGLDAGAKWCRAPEKGGPSSEEWAREGLSRGEWVRETRSGWARTARPAGPAPRPPWLCTVSVRAGSLGEMHTCIEPEASCVPARPCRGCPRSGRNTAGIQLAVGGLAGSKQVYLSFPESTPDQPDRLGMESPFSGEVSCRESASAARLSSPGIWTARSDLSRVWLQRRRWRASCDMRRDRIPPIRLMYDTVLSVRTNTCLPNSSGRNCRKARCTASSSRQLMCQSSRGPVQSPEAACPLHVAPQPVLEASVVTTTCRDTCSKGTPARRKARSVQGLKERRHSCVMFTRSAPRRHAHLGTQECNQCWSGLIWSNPSGVTAATDAICPRSLWNSFSGATVLPLKELRQFSTDWARYSVRRAVILTESTPHQEKRFSAQGRACSFPSWPEAPTGWGAEAPGPCDRTTVLGRGPCSRQLRILMPTSRNGARAPSAIFVKTREDRESPKGRTLYCHARPSDANRRNSLCRGWIETWK